MENKELSVFIGETIKALRHSKGWTQTELGEQLGVAKTTIAGYEKGYRAPLQKTLFKLAAVFGVTIDDFFPPIRKTTSPDVENDTLQAINDTVIQLHPERQVDVLEYAVTQLDEQEKEQLEKAREVNEPIVLHPVETVTELAAGLGYSYDDNDVKTVLVEEEPPRYDIASLVNGDSMLPDYENGDIVYLKDTGMSSYSGQVCAVAVNDKSYLKKVYTEDDCLRLVSINPKYDDIIIDFPPAEDTHIKIYAVIGSDKVVQN